MVAHEQTERDGGGPPAARLLPDPVAPADEPIVGPGDAPETDQLVAVPRLARHEVVLDDDHRVGVAVCGQGLPVVLVHGFTAEGILYAQTLSRLVRMGFKVIEGTPVGTDVYAQMLRSHDDGIAEFLDLARVKPNTLGNSRMLLELD